MQKPFAALGAVALAALTIHAAGATAPALGPRIDAVMARPEFRHAIFGVEFLSLDTGQPIYTHNADTFFVPGSTTKLVTMGSALELLGRDYRFHTRVYRTGEIGADGALRGDLVLVASGDPNLSGRIRPGDALAFENMDHSYGGPDSHGLDGDPLGIVRELAGQVASHGVKRIDGRVIVDASLYAEGERDGGTGFVVSPIMINDNAVDVRVTPGSPGAPATLAISPVTAYARFVNRTVTGTPGSESTLDIGSDVAAGDGTRTITVVGNVAADAKPAMWAYRVPTPSRYAEIALAEALHEHGIVAAARLNEDKPELTKAAAAYIPANLVAEHMSPPYGEEVKITLKVSQNLHATATPYLLGAVLAHKGTPEAGFGRMRTFLETTGADVTGASQSDGAGADAHFTPAFMTAYLAFMAKQKDGPFFHDALPVLGRDGTLFNIQTGSPAAGHVFAKTGTYEVEDLLHHQMMVTGKGMAGYMTTANGRHLAFAAYINNLEVKDADAVTAVAGQALGEIAAAAYDAKPAAARR